MFHVSRFVVCSCCLLLLAAILCSVAPASALQPGDTAPAFSVYAGNRRFSYPASFSGKVLVITHEIRDVVEKNRPFKNRVIAFCASPENASGTVVPLPVVDCSEYFGLIKKYCAAKVEEHSRKERLQLYTDHDGLMRRDFGLQEHESNIVIIDRYGIIRYRSAGMITAPESERIIALIRQLLAE